MVIETVLHHILGIIIRHQGTYLSSNAANFPLDICDAHLLSSLVVVVVPFALGEVDGSERRVGLDTGSLELALGTYVSSRHRRLASRGRTHTSALKSTNSRPRQSMVRMF